MSVGGYHAAKLKRYDELIEYQISKSNQEVINMLNTKYLIVPGQDKTPTVQINFSALGNVWFVRNYKMVPNADAELNALSNFKAAQTAVIDSRFEKELASFKFTPNDTIGNTIKLTSYAPNHLVYESNAKTDQLAVFS